MEKRITFGLCIGGVCALAWSNASVAQVVVPLPPPTDLTRPQAPLQAPEPVLRVVPSDPGVPKAIADMRVDIASVELQGVTAYPAGTFDAELFKLAGTQVPLAGLFKAAAAIEARYRRDGYTLVRAIVPAQEAVGGRYRIQVIEGYVSAVELTGDPGDQAALLRRYLDKVMLGRPARISDIERALLLANDLPGISARAVLTPSGDTAGAAKLVVDVHRTSVNAFATINNRGSRFAGPIAGTLGLDLNGLGSFGGHVGGVYFTTFDREQNYGELSLDAHIGGGGLKLRTWASYALSRPGSTLTPLDIRSRSLDIGYGLTYPVIRTRAVSVTANGSFELTDDRTDILGSKDSIDRQRIVRIGLSAQFRDGWRGSNSISITLHKGLDILGASNANDAVPQSRLGGRSDFFKITGTVSRYQPLYSAPWGGVALQFSFAGQYAADKLLSLEQFHVGGEALGRGFNPSQYSGDQGVGGDIELQVTSVQPIGPFTGQQLYGFFDAASVRDRGVPGWTGIQSAGGGLRADLGPRLSAQVEAAVPYKGGRQVGPRLDRGAQFFFRLTARY